MSITRNKASIEGFLSVIMGSREAGLVIAKNDKELANFIKVVDKFNLKPLLSVFEYQNASHGWYIVINDRTKYKDIYDFVCQYPLTVITLFDSVNSKTFSCKPDYKNPIIFLITEETLKDVQKTGFNLLGRAGLAYRTE